MSPDFPKFLSLMGEGIPETGAEVVEIGAARIVLIHGVGAAERVHREDHGLGHIGEAESHAGAALDIVGPVLMQAVDSAVEVPIELGLKSGVGFGFRESVAGAVLGIEEQ